MSLLKYLFHRPLSHRLPVIPRQYSVEFDPRDIDLDTATLMRQTQIRSPQAVKLLMKKHRANSARVLIETLPPRKRPRHVRRRAVNLFLRAFGLTAHDPMKAIARKHRRSGRR